LKICDIIGAQTKRGVNAAMAGRRNRTVRSTALLEYYNLTAVYEFPDTVDFDLIEGKVDDFNDRGSYLHFLSSEVGDDGLKLRFLYIAEAEDDADDFRLMMQRVDSALETKTEYERLYPEHLKPHELKALRTAKRLMQRNAYCGESAVLWPRLDTLGVLNAADEMIGFGEFKSGLRKLRDYCEAVRLRGAKGVYNVVFLNTGGVEPTPFVRSVYELLSSEGLLDDHCVITGELNDAVRTDKDTAFVYHIDQMWDIDSRNDYRSASKAVRLLQKLAKRNAVYVTSMDRTQYEQAIEVDDFRRVFAHVIELSAPSVDEKWQMLSRDAEKLGVTLDEDGIRGSEVLQMEQSALDAALVAAANRIITRGENAPVTASDFDKRLAKTEKVNAYDELNKMVGLTGVKDRVNEIISFLKKRGNDALPCLHMVFRGNPGTGKTSVARLIAKIFAQEGICKKDVFIETDREGLCASYVGQTAPKTAARVSEAQGGVLFIDEAYLLGYSDSGRDYGSEAIATLVKRMEDYRKEFVCIMAGYTEEMDKMLDINPGLRDRVQFYIDFPDYSQDELVTIFRDLCTADKYGLDADAESVLSEYFDLVLRRKDKNFANARIVRKVFERVRVKQAMRVSDPDDMLITKTDIDDAFAETDMRALLNGRDKGVTIGFRLAS
jgi:AAA+ superfamily predicted ATPase